MYSSDYVATPGWWYTCGRRRNRLCIAWGQSLEMIQRANTTLAAYLHQSFTHNQSIGGCCSCSLSLSLTLLPAASINFDGNSVVVNYDRVAIWTSIIYPKWLLFVEPNRHHTRAPREEKSKQKGSYKSSIICTRQYADPKPCSIWTLWAKLKQSLFFSKLEKACIR
jgi:hypothetical protein